MNFYIENFQSIQSLHISLEKGLTPIIGESDIGKSAIVRAYQSLTTNNWEANFLSHGKDECILGITLPETSPYDLLTLTKSKSKNQYDLYKLKEGAQHPQLVEISAIIKSPNYQVVETYPKIGGQPHEKILEVLNHPYIKTVRDDKIDLAVRDQLTTLFMVTESSQYNTSLINQLSGLDAIDLAIKDSNKLSNTSKSLLTSLPSEINQLKTSLSESEKKSQILESRIEIINKMMEMNQEYEQNKKDITIAEEGHEKVSETVRYLSTLRATARTKEFITTEKEMPQLTSSETSLQLEKAKILLNDIKEAQACANANHKAIERLRPIEGLNSIDLLQQETNTLEIIQEAERLKDAISEITSGIGENKKDSNTLKEELEGVQTVDEFTIIDDNIKKITLAQDGYDEIRKCMEEIEKTKEKIKTLKDNLKYTLKYEDHKETLMHIAFESCPECHQKLKEERAI